MKTHLWIAALALLLAGCVGGMIPGKLYSLSDATVLGFAIEKSYGTGTMTATSFTVPTEATARGVLMGDQGTVIELWLEIQPGIAPKGHGEGTDNKGNRYQVQF